MDILNFFWTFYLNHLSHLQGYFFVVVAKNKCLYVGHKSKLVSKWSFQAKLQCKNKGFKLKLTEDGGTIQSILFPGIKLTLYRSGMVNLKSFISKVLL